MDPEEAKEDDSKVEVNTTVRIIFIFIGVASLCGLILLSINRSASFNNDQADPYSKENKPVSSGNSKVQGVLQGPPQLENSVTSPKISSSPKQSPKQEQVANTSPSPSPSPEISPSPSPSAEIAPSPDPSPIESPS